MGELAEGRRPAKRRDNEPLLLRLTMAAVKRGVRRIVPAPADQRRVLLVFGCQRSGTTMLQQSILNRSWRTVILEEHDRRLVKRSDSERLRWDDLQRVCPRIAALPFELVVAKPLVESHRVAELLDACGKAQGIWMLRDYNSVARSNVDRFGEQNGLRDLRLLVDGRPADWRGAVSEDVKEQVASLLASSLSPADAAAVFWWARNRLYLDQELWRDNRVRVVRYESLVQTPNEHLVALSRFVALPLPLRAMGRRIRPAKTIAGAVRPDVDVLCRDLQRKLESMPQLLMPERTDAATTDSSAHT